MTIARSNSVPSKFLFDTFFNSNFDEFFAPQKNSTLAAVNVHESDTNFTIEVAAPGFEKEHFDVKIENETLIISAKNEQESKTDEVQWRRREFVATSFERSFKLPKTVDIEAINARYENGVLTLNLTKKPEAHPIVKTIEIA